jgi:[acyl-carrier-protein] S-malonyltransferase
MERIHSAALNADALNCVDLAVSLPYHHPILAKGTDEILSRFLDTISWTTPRMPLISTIDQQLLTGETEIKGFIARHLSHPIHWHHTVEALHAQGINDIFECGPGISLTQNARFLPGKIRWISIKKSAKRAGA